MKDILKTLGDAVQDAMTPTTWRVGDHVAKKKTKGLMTEEETETVFVCTTCGTEADMREELAEMTCWEEVEE